MVGRSRVFSDTLPKGVFLYFFPSKSNHLTKKLKEAEEDDYCNEC